MSLVVAFLALLLGIPAAYAEASHVAASGKSEPAFFFGFDRPPDVVDDEQHYVAGGSLGVVGHVLTANRGALRRLSDGSGGVAVRFPAQCRGRDADCPRAVVEVPHRSGLNPGDRDISFGARVLLQRDETTDGSNIMQKGRYRTPGGQWKLQIDGRAGRPSCVFRGAPGRRGPSVAVMSTVSVATGTWHRVRCVMTAGRTAVVVDGIATSVPASVQGVANTDPVRLGGPGLAADDDQYHGRLDDVFLRIRSR